MNHRSFTLRVTLHALWRFVMGGLLGIVFTACHDTRYAPGPSLAEGEELPILHQQSGVHSHETRAMQLVIRDPQTLAQIPLADVPVDFSRQMLLVVTLGQVTSDEYGVRIARVWREGGRLRVEVETHAPSTSPRIAMASPYCIAVVPKCDLNVDGFLIAPPTRTRSWEQSPPPEFGQGSTRQKKPPNYNPEAKR